MCAKWAVSVLRFYCSVSGLPIREQHASVQDSKKNDKNVIFIAYGS